MNRYLLDTNRLSAYLDRHAILEARIDAAMRAGDRFGITLPVMCEYRAGIAIGRRSQRNLGRLQAAVARQHDLTLLTADGDFQGVPRLRTENWLP
jgi:predicted nucleic acid-binding protein